MNIYCGIDWSHSSLCEPSNPSGYRNAYGGDYAKLAADLEYLPGDGVFVRFADGACDARDVGQRSDGKIILTNACSADMMSETEHAARLEPVRDILRRKPVVWFTGIPETDQGVPKAVQRLWDMGLTKVAIDVSGRNLSDRVSRFVKTLRTRGITVYGEPLAVSHQPPAWMADSATCSLHEVLEQAVRLGVPIPRGSLVWFNGGDRRPTEPELEDWAARGCEGAVIAKGLLSQGGAL